jgi:hypothetical protein
MTPASFRALCRHLLEIGGGDADVPVPLFLDRAVWHLAAEKRSDRCCWSSVPSEVVKEVPLRELCVPSPAPDLCPQIRFSLRKLLVRAGDQFAWCADGFTTAHVVWDAAILARQLGSRSAATRTKAFRAAPGRAQALAELSAEWSVPVWFREWCDQVVDDLRAGCVSADMGAVRDAARATVFDAMTRDGCVVPSEGEPTVLLGSWLGDSHQPVVGALHVAFELGSCGDRRVLEVPVSMSGWVFGLYARHASSVMKMPARVIAVTGPRPSEWSLVAELSASASWEEAVEVAALLESESVAVQRLQPAVV